MIDEEYHIQILPWCSLGGIEQKSLITHSAILVIFKAGLTGATRNWSLLNQVASFYIKEYTDKLLSNSTQKETQKEEIQKLCNSR